jgi:hypothetical protein
MLEYPKGKYRLVDGVLECVAVQTPEEEKQYKGWANNPTELGVETCPALVTTAVPSVPVAKKPATKKSAVKKPAVKSTKKKGR